MYVFSGKMEPWILTTCYPGYSESACQLTAYLHDLVHLPHSDFVFIIVVYCCIPSPQKGSQHINCQMNNNPVRRYYYYAGFTDEETKVEQG